MRHHVLIITQQRFIELSKQAKNMMHDRHEARVHAKR
jgi:hypothetical protein